MILCTVKFNGSKLNEISISGHAEYAEYGSDIVCSAVSMLAFSIANKMLKIDEKSDVTITENEFKFKSQKNKPEIDLLLETLYDGLLMVEDQYGKYLTIKEV